MGQIKVKSIDVKMSLNDDLKKAEQSLKNAILKYGSIEDQFKKATSDLVSEREKAYSVAMNFNNASNELGLKAIDNVTYKMLDTYFSSDVVRKAKG